MNVTHFHEIFLQNWLFSLTGLIGLSMQTLKKKEWTEVSWRNNVHNVKFTLKTRLENSVGIEYTYFH